MPQTPRGPLRRYRALLQSGKLKPDAQQASAAEALQSLYRALKTYRPKPSGFLRFFAPTRASEPPKGLYIHGDVGRGKSALMDLFFTSARVQHKRRIHFNAF